jgi:hypothetical protein
VDVLEEFLYLMNADEPPWSILLSPNIELGSVECWTPREMLRLRGTCQALRWHSSCLLGGRSQSTAAFFADMIVQGLQVNLVDWQDASVADLYGACRRIFMERLLISSIPAVVAAAAKDSHNVDPSCCAIFGGGYPLHRRLLADTPFNANTQLDPHRPVLGWTPGDLDIFVPFGCPSAAPAKVIQTSQAVLDAVTQHVLDLLPHTRGPSRTVPTYEVVHRSGYDEPIGNYDPRELGEGPASDEDAPTAQVTPTASSHRPFVEPEEPKTGETYTRGMLRAAAAADLRDLINDHENDHENDPSSDPIALPYSILRGTQRSLLDGGLLDGRSDEILGRPRKYKVARVIDVFCTLRIDGETFRYKSCKTAGQHEDDDLLCEEWRCPKKINIVQYHGEPLAPLHLVSGFDLLTPQIATGVTPGTAQLHFLCTPEAEETIKARELRLTPNTWGASYHGTEPLGLLRAAWAQLRRIEKYEERGFKLILPATGRQ